MIDPNRLSRIVRNLTLSIPAPYKPPPKPQASWRTLKIGVKLKCLKGWAVGRGVVPVDQEFEVTGCDSQGLTLTPIGDTISNRVRWEDPDWKLSFEKVKSKRKGSKK